MNDEVHMPISGLKTKTFFPLTKTRSTFFFDEEKKNLKKGHGDNFNFPSLLSVSQLTELFFRE